MPPRRRTSPRSPDHEALGQAIEKLRKDAGLTHEELAERTGMSFQRISELERGIANPTFATLVRMTEGLGVQLSDIASLAEKIRDEKRN